MSPRTLTLQNQLRSTTSGIEYDDNLDLALAETLVNEAFISDSTQVSGTLIMDLNFIRTAIRDIKGDTTYNWFDPVNDTVGLITLSGIKGQLDLKVSTSGDTMTGNLLLPNGTVSGPALSFSNATDTGVFLNANNVDISVDNGTRFRVRPDAVRFFEPLILPIGSVSEPATRFVGDSAGRHNGIYRPAAAELGFVTDGIQAGRFDGTQNLIVTNSGIFGGKLTSPSGIFDESLTVSGLPVVTSLAGTVEEVDGFFAQTVTGVVTLVERAAYARDIQDFTGQVFSGAVSGTISIDGTDVDGITNEVWNTSQVISTATGSNSIPVGGRMLLTISGESDFERFGWSYSSERA